MTRKKILILTATEGHLSLANSVAELLTKTGRYQIEISDHFSQDKIFSLYRLIYRFVPLSMKLPFYLNKLKQVRQLTKSYFKQSKELEVLKTIRKIKPDLIISTYFGYTPILEENKTKLKFKFIQIITDPISIHPILYSAKADYNLGFDENMVEIGIKLGIAKSRLKPIGWLTRPRFFKKYNLDRIRKEIGFSNQLTFLVCGGSEGSGTVLNTLPSLLFTNHPQLLQIIFVSGTNKSLKKLIDQAVKLAQKLKFQKTKILNLAFTDKMAEFIAISDLIIGKAGPNLVFESIAQNKPFMAISHINGQEDGNLKLIKKYGFGWVAENPIHFNRLIKQILKEPRLLEEKAIKTRQLAQMNKQAETKLIKLVEDLIG